MKIDIAAHILPQGYLEALRKKIDPGPEFRPLRNRAVWDLDMRLRLMDRNPDVMQVLSVSLPPLETIVQPKDAVELARIANDNLA